MSKTVWLQGIGHHEAVEAREIKSGMVCCWNAGYKSDVLAVEPSKTGKTVTATLRSRQDGKTYERRMRAARLVAVEQ
jgi:translation elongation factor P/translation initiation factor 5A